jgi:hypothetical protein
LKSLYNVNQIDKGVERDMSQFQAGEAVPDFTLPGSNDQDVH